MMIDKKPLATFRPPHHRAGLPPTRLLFRNTALAGSLLLLSLTAQAQPAATAPDQSGTGQATQLGSLVVTARHREEAAEDVPTPVSVVSGQELATEKLDRVSDYSAKIPSFQGVLQNTRVSTLTVRGLGANANSDGSESSVGLIVDNVFFTHPGFAWLDFVDLESVQLARGPQGTLLGKNTTLGALVVTTQKPSFSPAAQVSVSAIERNRYQLRTNLTGPLSDEWAGRLTFYGDKGDGWIDNDHNGDALLDVNRIAARGQLLYDTDRFSNRIILERYQTKEQNNWYAPVGDVTTYQDGAARPGAWENILINRFGYTPQYGLDVNANLDNQQALKSRTTGLSNQADWYLDSGFTLTSVTAWRQLYFRPYNDTDLTPFDIFRAGYDVDVDQYSQEFRIASPEGGQLDWQAGVYLLHQDITSNYRQIAGADAARYFLAPALTANGVPEAFWPLATDGLEYSQLGETEVNSAAVFGQTTWRPTDRFSLTTGLRYTREKREASNLAAVTNPGPDLSALPAALQGALPLFRAGLVSSLGGEFEVKDSRSDGSFSWLINPSYRFNDQVLGYASVAYGEKSGAANLGAKPGDPVIIDPEKVHDYTLGLKTTFWNGRGYFHPNLFLTEIADYHASYIDSSGGGAARAYLANAGKVRLRGVEVEGSLPLGEWFRFGFSGAFNDAKYLSYRNAPAAVDTSNANPATDLSGSRFPTPRVTGQVSLNYDQLLGNGFSLYGYVNQTYRGDTFYHRDTGYGRQDAYTLTNIGLGLRGRQDGWSVQLWARNLFDERYILATAPASAVTPYIAVLGDPRTVGLTLSLNLR